MRLDVRKIIIVGVQYILDSGRRKGQEDEAESVKVELSHLTVPRGGHILHEQEYNTRHAV